MKSYFFTLAICLLSLLLYSCSYMHQSVDENYKPLGTAVLAANDLLSVKYIESKPEHVQENEYKDLLKEKYKQMYERLRPYTVEIEKIDNNYRVRVLDAKKLILTDWLCTDSRIDCWSYDGECNPDTITIKCD